MPHCLWTTGRDERTHAIAYVSSDSIFVGPENCVSTPVSEIVLISMLLLHVKFQLLGKYYMLQSHHGKSVKTKHVEDVWALVCSIRNETPVNRAMHDSMDSINDEIQLVSKHITDAAKHTLPCLKPRKQRFYPEANL